MGYIFLFMGIIGLAYSLIFLRLKKNEVKKNVILALLSTSLLFIGVYEFGHSQSDHEKSETTELRSDSTSNDNDQEINYSLGITPDQFLQSFNILSEQQSLQDFYYIDKLNIEEGKENVDTFQTELTIRVGIAGTVNKADGTLGFVQMLLVPDNSNQNSIDLNNLVLMLTSTVDPKITEEGIQYVSDKVIQNLSSDESGITIYENGFAYLTIKSESNLIFRITKF